MGVPGCNTALGGSAPGVGLSAGVTAVAGNAGTGGGEGGGGVGGKAGCPARPRPRQNPAYSSMIASKTQIPSTRNSSLRLQCCDGLPEDGGKDTRPLVSGFILVLRPLWHVGAIDDKRMVRSSAARIDIHSPKPIFTKEGVITLDRF